ncbi:hypothetical protein MCOR27_007119 [Pyricularia oryzae]|uniref:Uncharacterized protein n=1 Tax=Pyricularia oryzae TaxID=318829 RepID=A0A4P7NNM7_PYROR|nr:hypothetical protein MCOR01_002481 [Pyricularia oryzae]KAI6256743.1 hypothetical protein MCOR19_006800 [Pyricularia oryzae]KAI6266286.1 hypothetical protein MCOR26_010271 [Pyricularia oryzae]KAI6275081.1 hypothetical protein MCOR27_007119 [Pyricularia oryzae]KAI6308172.1 hypothetical protein MCOR34_007318 [Pyricularia oryzae]
MSTTTTSTRSCESDDSLTDIEDEWCSKPAHHKNPNVGGSWTVVTLQSARGDCVHDMDRSDVELTPKERLQIVAGASAKLAVAPVQGLMALSRRHGNWTFFIIATTAARQR